MLAILALVGAAHAAAPPADPPPSVALQAVSLEDAVRQAGQGPTVRAMADAQSAAWAQYAQAWPGRLPSVSVQANALLYNDEQTFSLVESDTPVDCSAFPEAFASMCEGFAEPTVVREQVTTSFTARVSVPITGQVMIDRQVAAAHANAEAADASLDGAGADARYAALDAWYGAVQAEQQVAIAESQLKSLDERVQSAQASFDAGALVKSDLLLAEIAQSQARQTLLQLTGFRDAAYGRLGVAIGNGGQPVRPSNAPEDMPRSPPDVDALIGRALANRPEIVAMRDRVQAAHASALAASWARLPTVNAMGAYSHQTGQGVFAEPDTAYVGATLDWNVWSWGKAAAGARVARANAEQVEHQLEALQANVRQDVRTRTQSLTTALAGAQVAAITVEQAEENHRIQEKRLGVGGGTMQELLDADLALEKARSTRATAIFDAHRAAAALERAVGGDPWTE